MFVIMTYVDRSWWKQILIWTITVPFFNRGAELTNTNLIRRVEERKEKEAEILSNIKKKMERLKLRQERLHQKSTINSDDHFIGKISNLIIPMK